MKWLVVLVSLLLGGATMWLFMIYSARKIVRNGRSSAPVGDYWIKGHASSMLYHTPDSPHYEAIAAEVWFSNEEDARRAGFAPWRNLTA